MEEPGSNGKLRRQDLSNNEKKEEKDETDGVAGFHTGITPRSRYFNGASQLYMVPIGRGQRELIIDRDPNANVDDLQLLKRPPGREAYPGDVFATHSKQPDSQPIVSADPVALERQISLAQLQLDSASQLKGASRERLQQGPASKHK